MLLGSAAGNALALGLLGGGPTLGGGFTGGSLGGSLNEMRRQHDSRLRDSIDRRVAADPVAALQRARARTVATLLRQHRDMLDADPQGAPVRRRQMLAWSPSAAAQAAAQQHGFAVLGQRDLGGLKETVIGYGVPDLLSTDAALQLLRTVDPQGDYDFSHLYFGSGTTTHDERDGATQANAAMPYQTASDAGPVRIGLVDSGVAATHPALRHVSIRRSGCNDKSVPSSHGTAVASLMLGHDGKFQGVAPDAQLYAADVYCGVATGGAADQIAAALAWMAGKQVGVIDLSLVGRPNRTLEKVVVAMLRHGHILTGAVGNDGSGAPPFYPASYPGRGRRHGGRFASACVDGGGAWSAGHVRRARQRDAGGADRWCAVSSRARRQWWRHCWPNSYPVRICKKARDAIAMLTAQVQRPQQPPVQRTDALGWGVVGAAFRVVPGSLD